MTKRSWIRSIFARPVTRTIRRAPRKTRLAMEALEDRTVPTTFTVTNTNDSGAGSLRDAVASANANTGPDTIIFDNAVFNTAHTITLTSGELDLTDTATTTITGPGANLLSISGNNASRVLVVDVNASAAFSGLTVTGGNSTNAAGIYVNGGNLIANSIVISGNHSTDSGNGGAGLGTDTAVVTISNSAIVNNTSAGVGGGVFEYFNSNLTLINCTLAGNSAGGSGGAIENYAPLTLENCTLSSNSAAFGGGIQNGAATTVTLSNTIIAGNTDASGNPDVSGATDWVSQGHNLIGKTDGSSGWVGSDLTGTVATPLNPQLAALANNGGPSQTIALLPNSPAINAGDLTLAPTTDQRGLTRFGSTDIGAFEYQFKVTATADSGAGSLRQAILNANAASTADTIIFTSLFNTAQIIALTSGQLTLTDAATTTISGPGAALLTVSGNNTFGLLKINSGATTAISGLTLTHGNNINNSQGEGGGAVYNDGTLTMSNCLVTGNTASSAWGGGGISNHGTATLTNSTISSNTSNGNGVIGGGGGVSNLGILTVADCTISGNTSTQFGGGGLENAYTAVAMLTDSTISGNTARGGAGLDMDGGNAGGVGMTLTLIDCTVSGNTATAGPGGGFYAIRGGAATFTNCTVSGNTASTSSGGGFAISFGGVTMTIANTIVAGNTASSLPDVSGTVSSQGHNLIGIIGGSGWVASDLTGTLATPLNPHLAALANNGGPTQTMALLLGSPAIDAGSNALAVGQATDQRGAVRIANGTVDIGAYEVQVIYWDPGHSASGTGSGGNGAWDTSTANWFNGISDVTWSNTDGPVAVFAGSAGTVTLGTGITASGLTFNTTGYTVTGNTLTLAGGAGAISIGSGATDTVSSVIAGSVGLTLSGGGILVLSGADIYSGTTTINAGILRAGAANALSANSAVTLANVAGTTLDLNNFSNTISVLSGGGTAGGNVTLGSGTLTTGNGSSTTFAGSMSGTGGLTVQGAGTFILSGTNSFTGTTLVTSGVLALDNPLNNGGDGRIHSAVVTINSGATFRYLTSNVVLNSTAFIVNGTLDMNTHDDGIGSISGSGLIINNSTNTFEGLSLDNMNSASTFTGNISGNGRLGLRGLSSSIGSLTLSGGTYAFSRIDVGNGTLNLNGAVTTTSDLIVGSTQGFGLPTTGSAAVNVQGGSLAVGGSLKLGAASVAGTFSQSGGATSTTGIDMNTGSGGTGSGTLNLTSGTLTVGSSGIIASDAGGATTLNLAGGTLKASATFSASVAATLTNTTIFDTNGFNVTYAGALSGAGALTKAGAGTLTLTGTNNYGGGTSVNAGTLLVTGTLGSGAVTIAPSATLNDQAINTNDTGLGSLRQAMLNAKAASGAGVNLITFNITGSGVHVISPHTSLPTLSSAVLLDGTSQPGYSGTPLIELDGVSAGAGVNGLNLAASSIIVQGLEINQFLGDGITVTVGGDTVRGNLIGTNVAGAANLGNSGNGVRIASGASGDTIGGTGAGAGNVIAFNTLAGVSVTGRDFQRQFHPRQLHLCQWRPRHQLERQRQ